MATKAELEQALDVAQKVIKELERQKDERAGIVDESVTVTGAYFREMTMRAEMVGMIEKHNEQLMRVVELLAPNQERP